ncbi:carboxylic ester hydrolase [Novosphingobium endophyticum]|uniref:Carboxylic ester hydrolase n=1 Tax=Novosphingobium endophyticum TaxID=1955250 RepID=A0A916X5P3_9SPHN|nr:carboxylesterase family protein [Novosphingobium endophyticum]GGC02559.1 carboxylic ester hydrolase [Novosphingobium endophyticum]
MKRRGSWGAIVAAMVAAAALTCGSSASASGQGNSNAAVVTVPGGTIRGAERGDSLVFEGIPFAAPPLGKLRWSPPRPVVPWQGIRDATPRPPACLQNDESWNRADWLYASEDCLTLNVRTPSLTGKRPVMVWIHGGSNRAGSALGPVESQMVRHGIVVVSVQYRLGILGFLSHRQLAEQQGGTSGNYGLMDQIAALRWVRDNIGRFGGDPAQVTIFGESAGSQDVSLLLAAPSAQGLFRAAILQSGTPGFGMSFRTLEGGFRIGDELDRMADSGGDIAKLRALSPVALFDLQSRLTEPESQGNDFLFLRTTIDGAVLPDRPDRLLKNVAPKPVIIGTDTVEFGPGPGGVDLAGFSRFWFGANSDKALAIYRAEETKGADPRRGNLELRMQSDAQFHCPANRLAGLLTREGWPVWRYEFDIGENGGLTRHAYEVSYVFDAKPAGGGARMQDYWVALAMAGDPNAPIASAGKRPEWKRLTRSHSRTLHFAEKTTVMAKGLPRQDFCGWTDNY